MPFMTTAVSTSTCYSILVNLYCTISGSEQTETAIVGLGLSLEDTLELLYQHVTNRIHLSLAATKDTVNYSQSQMDCRFNQQE